MVLESLSKSLKNTLKKITGASKVDKELIDEVIKDIQRSLLRSDVNVHLVFEISKRIKERALKEELPQGLTRREHLIKIIYEELVNFVGKEKRLIEVTKKPYKVMLVGLFGSGKTTTAAKLARYYKVRGYKVALLQTDTWRPAAYDQLEQLAKQIQVDFYGSKQEKDALNIWKKYADKLQEYDIVFIDTAGRDVLNQELVDEINRLNKVIKPEETLLVMSADIGQAAEKQAKGFKELVNVTGVIITKLDGTAKGGGALTACAITKAPVKFIGVGEKVEDIEVFNPEGFISRLLGMGDLEALLEKARELEIKEEEAKERAERFLKGEFNLIDLYEQMRSMKKLGSLKKLMSLIPGFGQIDLPKEVLDVQEEKLEKWRYIMDSMTFEELSDPTILNPSRIKRIAKGSGTSEQEVRELIKHYKQSKKLMKLFKGKLNERDMEKMIKRLQKGGLGKLSKFRGNLGNIGKGIGGIR